ncbi:MAG: HlyC/CorC family transporter [Armatimonadetes bacterium]|nr:HlyC/CorC family transporter [Armatimonadota bacterium]
MEILFQILLVFLLVLANGAFVAAEFAIVAVRKTRIEQLVQEGDKRAKLVHRALLDTDSFIAAAQLGITMASLAIGWVGEPLLAGLFHKWLTFLVVPFYVSEPPEVLSHTVAVAVAYILLTALHVILGEQAPKIMALDRAERVAFWVVPPTQLFMRLTHPFVKFTAWATRFVLRPFGFRPGAREAGAHSPEELKMLVTASQEAGIIEKQEEELVHKILEFGDSLARDIMTPRTEITGVEKGSPVSEFLEKVTESGYSRFPVFEENLDHIIGFLDLRKVLGSLVAGTVAADIADLMVPPFFVPESKKVGDLLREFQRTKYAMCIVLDEYGGTAGLVTLTDILEEIVGATEEAESLESAYQQLDERTLIVPATLKISDLNERAHLEIPEGEYQTLGGLISGLLDRIPNEGDYVLFHNYRFSVLDKKGYKISKVMVTRQ